MQQLIDAMQRFLGAGTEPTKTDNTGGRIVGLAIVALGLGGMLCGWF